MKSWCACVQVLLLLLLRDNAVPKNYPDFSESFYSDNTLQHHQNVFPKNSTSRKDKRSVI